jgi:hypothetical protein
METLFMLEDSAIGMMVSSTQWGYAIVLSLHAVGMGVMVGISLMLTLRVLGFANRIPLRALAPYWKVALFGFAINFVSGVMLFMGGASELFFNWAFRIKFVLVLIGVALTWRLVRTCIAVSPDDIGLRVTNPQHRKLAALTLGVWICALISGRLIGYLA